MLETLRPIARILGAVALALLYALVFVMPKGCGSPRWPLDFSWGDPSLVFVCNHRGAAIAACIVVLVVATMASFSRGRG